MKFAPLILKHLRKNWLRTLSTVLAMAVCIFLICTLQTVVDAVKFTCAARENPKSRMVRSFIGKYIGCDPRRQYRRKRRYSCRSIAYAHAPAARCLHCLWSAWNSLDCLLLA